MTGEECKILANKIGIYIKLHSIKDRVDKMLEELKEIKHKKTVSKKNPPLITIINFFGEK
jgi:hypothetical protein